MPEAPDRRISVVGNEIAPPQRNRVHADFRRGEIDKALGHRGRDRMADGAVLAHDVLVLKHHAGVGAVIRAGVRPADQIDHLVGLDAAGARIDRIGPDAGEIVDLERGDGAVVVDADLALDAMVAGVDVGDEAFQPVGDELYRPFQQFRERHRRHLVGIDMHLDAERAADIFGEHAHLMRLERKMLGENVLRHVRRLGALIDGEAFLALVPIGDDGARLVGDAGMAAEHEGRFGDRVRLGKRFIGVAGRERALEGEIVAEGWMDHRRRRIERGFGVGDGGERLVVDLDQRAAVFRFGAGARDYGADRLALPASAIDGDGVLRRRLDALEVRQHADPWRDHVAELGAGDDRDDARRFLCCRRIDGFDARVRVRRAYERHMRHARQHYVADILAAALRQPRQIRPRHRAADIRVRPVERGEAGRLVGGDFHFSCPPPAKRGSGAYNPLVPAKAGTQVSPMSFFVYILASRRNGTLYIGMTDDIVRRAWEHRTSVVAGFTKTYGVKTLVWYEVHEFAGRRIPARAPTQEMESGVEAAFD